MKNTLEKKVYKASLSEFRRRDFPVYVHANSVLGTLTSNIRDIFK